jgi:hypothetical protein
MNRILGGHDVIFLDIAVIIAEDPRSDQFLARKYPFRFEQNFGG